MTLWPPITRDDLKGAASSAGFDTVFPLLLRRLIAETAEGLTSLDMPGGSGTASGGFDGVVTTTVQTTFVPARTSVWELSVGGGQAKADDDYSKRLDGPDGLPTHDVTYVEALLVPWTKARAWVTEKQKDGRWREVRGYNLDRIHAWLDVAPATTAWLAEQLGKKLPGVSPLGSWWSDTWIPSTRLPLDKAFVLAGREKASAELAEQLVRGRRMITLGGDHRQDEARAFIAAAMEESGALDGSLPGVRTLFVSDATSLERLIAQPQPLILLLSNPALARDLPAHHPHQIIVTAPPGGQGDVEVPRIHSQIIETQLRAAGFSHDEAAKLGTLGRRSLLALRRALAHHPGTLTPDWATSPDVVRRRMLLLGSWNGENEEDRRVVSECLGRPYEDVQEQAIRLSAGDGIPFLGRVDDIWHVLAVEDAWTLLGGSLTSDDLEAARGAMAQVLRELDPVLDLDREERWVAAVHGVRRRFSASLRTGLAQTLAIVAAAGVLRGPRGLTGAHWAEVTVRNLLADANADGSYRLWLSVIDVLGLLAEAAPDAFIEAMRGGLVGATPLHAAMFADVDPDKFGMGSSSPHSHFLWALETLAWTPDHLDDAVDVLAALASLDPGGRLANRPAASLVGILSAWSPNTTADTGHRIRTIEWVVRKHPVVGRKLLLDLIPDGHGFQTVHPGPVFREWKRESPVSRADLVRVVDRVVELLIEGLGTSPEGYQEVIDKVDVLSPQQRTTLVDRLRALGATLEDDTQRAQLFDALREKIAKHREYSDAKWALPEEDLRSLQSARDALAPRDPVLRHAWLFRSDWVTLGDRRRRDDYDDYDAEVLSRRALAVGEAIDHRGLDAVADLAAGTEYPHLVGAALAEHSGTWDPEMLAWLQSDASPATDVAGGYLVRRLRDEGDELRDSLIAVAEDPLTRARILRLSGRPAASQALLPDLGPEVTEHYWREFVYFGLGRNFRGAVEAAWALLDVGRAAAALDLVMLYTTEESSTEAAQVAAAALEALLDADLKDAEIGRLDRYHFEQIFALLARHRDAVGRQRVVNLEWQLFPALGFDAKAPTLHHALAEDPAFFVELVTWCFRPDTSREDESVDPSELERRRDLATRAYEVLSSFHLVPGLSADGVLDGAHLRDWVLRARAALEAADRSKVGDGRIGELLAFVPPSADGSPIHEVTRDLLEEIRSDELDRGLARGIYNKRGVTSRGLLEGGTQEWDIAMTLREQAEAARNWPRTRKLLNGLAESYEAQARYEDEKAERRHQGLGG